MKRKQITFNTEQSIIKEIDALKAKQGELMILGERQESKGRELVRTGNPPDVEQGNWLLKKAAKSRASVDRCEAKLLKYKDALAAFRTELLPNVIENRTDRQVVL